MRLYVFVLKVMKMKLIIFFPSLKPFYHKDLESYVKNLDINSYFELKQMT